MKYCFVTKISPSVAGQPCDPPCCEWVNPPMLKISKIKCNLNNYMIFDNDLEIKKKSTNYLINEGEILISIRIFTQLQIGLKDLIKRVATGIYVSENVQVDIECRDGRVEGAISSRVLGSRELSNEYQHDRI